MMKKTIQETQEKTISTIESYFPKKNNKRSFDAEGKNKFSPCLFNTNLTFV
jgi:hypothetical protein